MMQISRSVDVPYPTACRMVQTLVHEGLLELEPNSKRYRPTALVQTLSHGFRGEGLLVQAARPHIISLTRELGWPVSITTRVGHSMVIRDCTHSQTSLTFSDYYPGFSLPILDSASGIAMLSFMGDEERHDIVESMKMLPEVNRYKVDFFETEKYTEEVRAKGYASRGLNKFTKNPGKTSSIAVPIMVDGNCRATLTLAFFSSAIRMAQAEEKFYPSLKKTANLIAHDLVELRAKAEK